MEESPNGNKLDDNKLAYDIGSSFALQRSIVFRGKSAERRASHLRFI
jgi:hypothetical protein